MSTMVMYGMMGNGIGANRADTTANGMSTTVTYGETVSGIEANRADTTANGTSATVTYGETVSGIGAKDITITTVTGKTVTTTVTTKTAIKIKESLPDSGPGSDLTPREKGAGGRTGGFLRRGDIRRWGAERRVLV
jgi:hypothetical protein